MPENDDDHGNQCPHEEVAKLELIDREYPAVHGPSTEIWRVRCQDCNKVFQERFIGD